MKNKSSSLLRTLIPLISRIMGFCHNAMYIRSPFFHVSKYFFTKSFRKIHLLSIQFFLNTMQKKTLNMTFRIYSDPLWFSKKSKLGTEKLSKRDEKHRAKIINHQPNTNPLICKLGWNIFWKTTYYYSHTSIHGYNQSE